MHKYNPIDELNVAHSKNRSPNYLKVGNNFNYKFDNLEKNIEKLIELSIKLNSKPIFVTQKTLRWKIVKDEVYSISKNDNYYLKEKNIRNNFKSLQQIQFNLFGRIQWYKF